MLNSSLKITNNLSSNSSPELTKELSSNSSPELTNEVIKLNVFDFAANPKSEWYDKYGNPTPGLLDYLFKF